MPLGKNIKRSAASEIATAKRAGILKAEVGIARKKKDMTFENAVRMFLDCPGNSEAAERNNTGSLGIYAARKEKGRPMEAAEEL